MDKHKSIIQLIGRLKMRMGEEAFDVVDHWDGDLMAIGIARPDNHDVLVYVCTFRKPPDEYFVSLELPPDPNDDYPYTPAGDYEVKSFDELVELIRRHFSSYP